jgi:hypothetical protein
LWCAPRAEADLTHWLVTEWGSVYHDFQKVAGKEYKEPQQIAGTADHYYVSTRDGSVYRDGVKIENQIHKDENVMDLDAWGDDYYMLTLQAGLYKNGKVIMEPDKIDRPRAMVVNGSDIWIINDAGKLYKNGEKVGEYFLKGYYPDHFAVAGSDVWSSISAGTTGGHYIYKNQDEANPETWIVRELAASNGDFYIFSGMSIFKNFERIAKFEADKNDTGHSDNPVDFHFVLPAR